MNSVTNDPPIACTLDASDYQSRLAWIGALNADALRDARLNGLRLELTYAADARERVRQLVRQEQACCAFLGFEVDEDAEQIRVVIEAPEGMRDAIETLFAPFRAAAPVSRGSRGS